MSGDSKQQTTQTSSEPWGAAQPALKTGLEDAQKLYKSGVGSQPYTGSTVVPYAQQTIQGMNNQETVANRYQPRFEEQAGRVYGNAAQGGLNELQRGSVDRLQGMAGGSMLTGNPYIDQVIGNTSEDIGKSSNLMASAAGRYGSGGHQGVIADAVGDVSSKMRMQNYDTERGYMQDAIGSLFNAGQQQQNNINANTGAMSDAYQAAMAPANTLQSIGGAYEDLQGRTMNDQMRIFSEMQNAPWQQIGRLQGVASGAGTMGGTGQTTAQGPSKIGSGIGGALAGYGMGGPAGAALGGLGGLFL
jgi:hypothetical protein